MTTIRHRVATDRTWGVEAQLRERAAQLKPEPVIEPSAAREPRGTPLGCCHRCSAVVYASDSLAMVGGYLVHGDCID